MSNRILKVNKVIRTELSQILTRELSLKPGVMITIVRVSAARDLSEARIAVSVFPAQEELYAIKTLSHERGHIQKLLHQRLYMKVLPKIIFIYDDVAERADTIEHIFHELDKERTQDKAIE